MAASLLSLSQCWLGRVAVVGWVVGGVAVVVACLLVGVGELLESSKMRRRGRRGEGIVLEEGRFSLDEEFLLLDELQVFPVVLEGLEVCDEFRLVVVEDEGDIGCLVRVGNEDFEDVESSEERRGEERRDEMRKGEG